MYIADGNNHRVQVFDFDLSGNPVYSSTIGITEEAGDDNVHFNLPSQLVIDNIGRVYVADAYNHRIQRCTRAATWTCTTFHGGNGTGANQLRLPFGLGRDGSGNIYIADSNNGRIKKCTTAGVCSVLITGINWVSDVAVDSSGNLFVNAWYDYTTRKYSAAGAYLGVFAGTQGVPYVTSAGLLNRPFGVAVAPDGSLYVTENQGNRLVKFNAAGNQQWAVGAPGVIGNDNIHLGNFDMGPAGNPGIDNSGQVYVPDSGNHRVQIFTAAGAYIATMGAPGQSGQDNNHFNYPYSISINPTNGDIVVADGDNHRIQIFTSSRVYKLTLGEPGVPGDDNTHFYYPHGVAVDKNGVIYVGDTENYRIQKCIPSGITYVCTTFAGEVGVYDGEFNHVHPGAVAVDNTGKVFSTDWNNGRVIVYDATGALLTVWGYSWGGSAAQIREVTGIAVDKAGNVYIADQGNSRVQKLAQGVIGWSQANINGFGSPSPTQIRSMEVFNDYLYAGGNDTAPLFRMDAAGNWTQVVSTSFGNSANWGVTSLATFNNELYAGIGNNTSTGGQIYRSSNGSTWTPVMTGGFGDIHNHMVTRLKEYKGMLYAGVMTHDEPLGAGIWRSPTGNNGSWTSSASDGFEGDDADFGISAMEVFSNTLYAATNNTTNGTDVWRTTDGLTWLRTSPEGFGEGADNGGVTSFVAFNNQFYAATSNCNTGGQIWRYNGGSSWTKVVNGGFGDINNCEIGNLIVFQGAMYAFTHNHPWNEYFTGGEVWRTTDGVNWVQVNQDGFGDSNTTSGSWGIKASAIYRGALYIGAFNPAGAEIWRSVNWTYLPIAVK
jgi:streptogramin lyase